MTTNTTTPSQTITLDGPDWTIATDTNNKGRDEKWFEVQRPEAKPATVPCTIQEIFPEGWVDGLYHRDDWVRRHPLFEGLPAGGLMDWTFYRTIAPVGRK